MFFMIIIFGVVSWHIGHVIERSRVQIPRNFQTLQQGLKVSAGNRGDKIRQILSTEILTKESIKEAIT